MIQAHDIQLFPYYGMGVTSRGVDLNMDGYGMGFGHPGHWGHGGYFAHHGHWGHHFFPIGFFFPPFRWGHFGHHWW
jgi:hypothetical protein